MEVRGIYRYAYLAEDMVVLPGQLFHLLFAENIWGRPEKGKCVSSSIFKKTFRRRQSLTLKCPKNAILH